jgi:UDP-2,3-diacylglucosamine pyrophosphatase LpxH
MKYRSVFISDVHLGTRGSKADILLSFLKEVECDNLFLVGDIFDGWRLKKNWYWLQSHSTVVQKILRLSRKGTRIYYIPGNHDEFMRQFLEHSFGNIELHDEMVYVSKNGKKYIVIHGDKFDIVTMNMKWLSHVGDWAYTSLLNINTAIHWIRSYFRLPYWSLSKWAKHKVKEAVNFIGNYEHSLTNYARIKHADGIICGHIHSANMDVIDGIEYLNCGDWVESCTALVEHEDGSFEVLSWRPESVDTIDIGSTRQQS